MWPVLLWQSNDREGPDFILMRLWGSKSAVLFGLLLGQAGWEQNEAESLKL